MSKLAVGLAAPVAGWSFDESGSYVAMFIAGGNNQFLRCDPDFKPRTLS